MKFRSGNNEAFDPASGSVTFAVLWRSGSAPPSLTLEAQLVLHPSDVLTSEPWNGSKVAGVNAQDGDHALERSIKTRHAERKSWPSGHEKAEDGRSSATSRASSYNLLPSP